MRLVLGFALALVLIAVGLIALAGTIEIVANGGRLEEIVTAGFVAVTLLGLGGLVVVLTVRAQRVRRLPPRSDDG